MSLHNSIMHQQYSGMTSPLVNFEVKISPRKDGEMDIKSQIEYLFDRLRAAQNELKEYKKLIETYRSEIAGMQRQLETYNNDNLKHIVPVIQHDTEFYNQAMEAQRQENINLQQRLTELKRDKAQMQHQLGQYQLRIAHMESGIGINR